MPDHYRPYVVRDGYLDRPRLAEFCRAVRANMAALGIANPGALYHALLDYLARAGTIDVRPLADLAQPVARGRAVVALRHDIDGDICAAVDVARSLATRGIAGSFYVLHTSNYYGYFDAGSGYFCRHPVMAGIVADLVATGCEVGVHADPLSPYAEWGVDGAAALAGEIAWMREQGADVRGTVGHNSAVVYGAESFEIFRGKSLWGRRAITWKDREIPLAVLDEGELGLTYEGSYPRINPAPDAAVVRAFVANSPPDAIRNRAWLESYFLQNPMYLPGYDASAWLLGADRWAVMRHRPPQSLIWPATTAGLLAFLEALDAGVRMVINVHPEYVSGA